MQRIRLVVTAVIFLTALLFGQLEYSEQFHLPWGDGDLNAGLREAPEGRLGPMSFSVSDSTLFLLDSPNKKLKILVHGKPTSELPLPNEFIDDFYWISNDSYYLLADNQIMAVRAGRNREVFGVENPRDLISGLTTDSAGNIQAIIKHKHLATMNNGSLMRTGSRETALPFIRHIRRQEIAFENAGKTNFTIQSTGDNFGTTEILGTTPGHNIYIYLEFITRQIPLTVRREIRLYSPNGRSLAAIDIPSHSHSRSFKEFHVDDAGNLYHMLSSKDGIHIIRWQLDESGLPVENIYEYPEQFREFHHYNLVEPLEEDFAVHSSDKSLATLDYPPVSRDESLAIGDTYAQHTWTATSANITNGTITDPNGVSICTPSWVGVGSNTKVPYKWGGFNTLDGYDSGLTEGKYAGDNATSGVSSYCVGVDCSGFVSRCWKLESHYSTRMMDDYITIAYSDWTDLQPADAVHKPGHVRLFVEHNDNNSLLVVEASGSDWRVSYRSFSYYDLTSYTPRYYRFMNQTALAAQPEIVAVKSSEQIDISWTLSSTDNLLGYAIDYSLDESWDRYNPAALVAPDKFSNKIDINSDNPIYLKICSVSTDTIDSDHSDTYGCFETGTVARILIVDGFDRRGSYGQARHSFVRSVGDVLTGSGISFESCSNDAILDGVVDLGNYSIVIWILGDESTSDETFNDSEQDLVEAYLRRGGKIFISGSELAWDLDYKGSATDQVFIKDYLKVLIDQDDSENYTVNGITGTPFSNLTLQFDDGTHGIYQEDYPDSYLPQDNAEILLTYGNGQAAACGFKGLVPNGMTEAGIVVMGFPVETVYNATERESLMVAVLEYLDVTMHTAPVVPQKFVLHGNYPNPFNSQTTFAVSVSQTQKYKLTVFNLLGQQIATVIDQELGPGRQEIPFKADLLSSGVYLYALEAGSFRKTGKIAVLK